MTRVSLSVVVVCGLLLVGFGRTADGSEEECHPTAPLSGGLGGAVTCGAIQSRIALVTRLAQSTGGTAQGTTQPATLPQSAQSQHNAQVRGAAISTPTPGTKPKRPFKRRRSHYMPDCLAPGVQVGSPCSCDVNGNDCQGKCDSAGSCLPPSAN
jgi:hypothetical protein